MGRPGYMGRSQWPRSLESPLGTREALLAAGVRLLRLRQIRMLSCPPVAQDLVSTSHWDSDLSRCPGGEPQASWPHCSWVQRPLESPGFAERVYTERLSCDSGSGGAFQGQRG